MTPFDASRHLMTGKEGKKNHTLQKISNYILFHATKVLERFFDVANSLLCNGL